MYLHLASVRLDQNDDGTYETREVDQGQIIGEGGCTGANAIHLHFELQHRTDAQEDDLPGDLRDVYGGVQTYEMPDVAVSVNEVRPGDFAGAQLTLPSDRAVDVVLVIDTTRSMADDIAGVKAAATSIVDDLASIPDSRIAVVDFRDYPGRDAVPESDYPYRDVLPFVPVIREGSTTLIKIAINRLELGDGGDDPESQNCALMHVIRESRCDGDELNVPGGFTGGADTGIGPWRFITNKWIIRLTDAPALQPPNDFSTQQVVEAAQAGGVTAVSGPATGPRASLSHPPRIGIHSVVVRDDPTAVADAATLAKGTGGMVFTGQNATDVVPAIKDAISQIKQQLQPRRQQQRCLGRGVTISGRGVIRGTKGADVILGSNRSDVIYGMGGGDRICGIDGNDRVYGGRNSDRLDGGKGNDYLVGGRGRDTCLGGPGRDRFSSSCEVRNQ